MRKRMIKMTMIFFERCVFGFLSACTYFVTTFFLRLSAIRLRQRSAEMRKTFWAGGERKEKYPNLIRVVRWDIYKF